MAEKRYSQPTWTRDVLQAASMTVGVCTEATGLVGIDFFTQDRRPFAHGHLDVETAEDFCRMLQAAIALARTQSAH